MGWHTCCVSLFNVHDPVKRQQAVEEVARGELDKAFVPGVSEDLDDYNSGEDNDEDDEKDELDVMKERQFGTRKSERKRKDPPASAASYMLNSSQIALSDDSDA